MKIAIEFTTDNDAFAEDRAHEVDRILAKVQSGVYVGNDRGLIHDINGNRIGVWTIED